MTPIHARIAESFARQTFLQTIGARLDAVEPGICRLSAPIAGHLLQQHGAGHGGLTFTLGDVAAGYAALSTLPPGSEVMTAEIKINLLRPALGERLEAIGTVLKSGRRLVVVRADIHALTGDTRTLVGTLLGTMVPVEP